MASTGLLVAAIRAMETTRDDRLFDDPFADKLSGDTGRRLLAAAIAATGERSTMQIVVRTRFFDEALLRAARVAKQVVILAAGMDARAYRLAWPNGTTVYELDQPAVIAAKADSLPTISHAVAASRLASTWPTTGRSALQTAGLDPEAPTVWLIEGLLQYLDEGAVRTLFERVDGLSAPNSILLYDVVGKTLLEAPIDGDSLASPWPSRVRPGSSAPMNRGSWPSAWAGRPS